MSRRTDRVNELLRSELSKHLREVKDPRVDDGLVTITEVVASPDLRHAMVYVSHLGDESTWPDVIAGLNHAAPFLRALMKPKLTMKNVPALHFEFDPSIERGARIASIIENLRPPSPETNG